MEVRFRREPAALIAAEIVAVVGPPAFYAIRSSPNFLPAVAQAVLQILMKTPTLARSR